MEIFFTGDMHFGHENIIEFDNRPFESVEEMDAELINRWNAKVGKDDLVYVLGDMIWKTRNDDAPSIIKSLNGKIILIKGNHDRFLHNEKAKAALAEIKDYDDICVTLKDGTTRRCILSHYFIPMYNGHRHKAIHLHAHSHVTDEADFEVDYAERLEKMGCRNEIYNVGCMYWNYEPVTLDEIIAHGKPIRPNYGERTEEHTIPMPIEEPSQTRLVWKAYCHSFNSKEIKVFNIFDHYGFRFGVKKYADKCKTKEEFGKRLERELLYYYWCKCEWEVIISPWISSSIDRKIKVDVYSQVMNNWDIFLDYVWKNRKKI